MRLGISSYCLSANMRDGKMTIYDVMDWAKAHDCEHMELEPRVFTPDLPIRLRSLYTQ